MSRKGVLPIDIGMNSMRGHGDHGYLQVRRNWNPAISKEMYPQVNLILKMMSRHQRTKPAVERKTSHFNRQGRKSQGYLREDILKKKP